jgi:hypothetical protein
LNLTPRLARRAEQAFLSYTYRWLKPSGELLFVILGERLAECSQILATHFRDVRIFRLEPPECVRYKQVVAFGEQWSRRRRARVGRLVQRGTQAAWGDQAARRAGMFSCAGERVEESVPEIDRKGAEAKADRVF